MNNFFTKNMNKKDEIEKYDVNTMILSWCGADDVLNYGQILQGCAMMYVIRNMNKGMIIYISYLTRGMKGKIKCFYKRYNVLTGHLIAYLKTKIMLNKFIKKCGISFYQVAEQKKLNKLVANVKLMICGSDQIWHPQNFDKNYFLGFGNDNVLRASYAASLPKSNTETQFKKQIQEIGIALRNLDYISVRENSSVDYISMLCSKHVESVLDPTYLVPYHIWYSFLEKIKIPNRYIFVYIPNGMDSKMIKYLEDVKELINTHEVIVLMTRGNMQVEMGRNIKFVSVGQFLYLIKNAAYIFTTSFHAVVFSTIFHKEFLCYDVINKLRGEDLRLIDLLGTLELKDRLISEQSKISEIYKIDYFKVDDRIEKKKKKSELYLKKVLEASLPGQP